MAEIIGLLSGRLAAVGGWTSVVRVTAYISSSEFVCDNQTSETYRSCYA